MGQMSITKAKKCAKPLYGENIMHRFDTETEYLKKVQEWGAKPNSVFDML